MDHLGFFVCFWVFFKIKNKSPSETPLLSFLSQKIDNASNLCHFKVNLSALT